MANTPTVKINQPAPTLTIPATGFLKLPAVLSFFPVSKTAWYEGIRLGKFPQSVKLAQRSSAWRCEDIRKLIEEVGEA